MLSLAQTYYLWPRDSYLWARDNNFLRALAPTGHRTTVTRTVRRIYATYMHSAIYYGPASVCLSVCLSITSWCSIETAECIERVLGSEAVFLSYTVL